MKWNDIIYFSSAAKAIKRTVKMSRFYEEFVFTLVFKLKIPGKQMSIVRPKRSCEGRQGSSTTVEYGLPWRDG